MLAWLIFWRWSLIHLSAICVRFASSPFIQNYKYDNRSDFRLLRGRSGRGLGSVAARLCPLGYGAHKTRAWRPLRTIPPRIGRILRQPACSNASSFANSPCNSDGRNWSVDRHRQILCCKTSSALRSWPSRTTPPTSKDGVTGCADLADVVLLPKDLEYIVISIPTF